jgi:hypothetical protein
LGSSTSSAGQALSSDPRSHEEEAQVGRFVYLLGNGIKEGLVERP